MNEIKIIFNEEQDLVNFSSSAGKYYLDKTCALSNLSEEKFIEMSTRILVQYFKLYKKDILDQQQVQE